IVGYPAGGSTDIVARLIGRRAHGRIAGGCGRSSNCLPGHLPPSLQQRYAPRRALRGVSMAEALLAAKSATTNQTENIRLYVLAFAVVLAAELIGIVNVPVGLGNIILLPLLWALLIGGVWSLAENYLPGWLRICTALQWRASAIVQLGCCCWWPSSVCS